MAKIGLSFSGGGIRSAALCSGVLRRLLQKNTPLEYLSCVSGGGYTGTAYLDWKYRHGKKDNKKWHQEFFDHMRTRAGLICNWQDPLQGILGSLTLFTLVLFVTFVFPLLLWSCYACPLAYTIDFFFGNTLRGGSQPCIVEARRNPNITADECRNRRQTSPNFERKLALFLTPGLLAILSYALKNLIPNAKGFFTFFATSCSVFLGLVSIPWFIDNFLRFLPDWLKIVLIVPTFFAWFAFPLMRKNATLLIVMYLYSFVIHWRVYRNDFIGFEYDDDVFNILLGISTLLLWCSNYIGSIQQRLAHVYVRWIIQRAFYFPQTLGRCGCAGISWSNLFLRCPTFRFKKQQINPGQALTLDDIDDLTPVYIGCVTVNGWRRTTFPTDPHYEVLTLSPDGVHRLDRPGAGRDLDGKLLLMDIFLSDSAATSAAALDYQMGGMQGDDATFRDLKTMLGLSVGASMVADSRHEDKRHFCKQILPLFIEMIRILPLVVFLVIYIETRRGKYLAIGILAFFAITVLLTLFAFVPTGSSSPGRLERVARWFTINVPSVHFMREIIQMTNQGPNPPPVLHLSDGGHIENLGILPLLKLRLKRIVAVDGGQIDLDKNYGQSLLIALELAREKLGCSFLGIDGRDVIEDIRDNFVERSPGSQPSSYRFKVQYYNKNPDTDGKTKVGEGDVLLITPRHPDKVSRNQPPVTWKEALRDIDVDLEAGLWGTGPSLSAEEADRLTFCCCECCHGYRCHGFYEFLCGAFPQHSTANQFFTSSLFAAYHREGYRACMEAKAEDFIREVLPQTDASVINV